jgi:hypothetical protein
VRTTVVVCTRLPPAPRIVMVCLPSAAFLPTVTFMVDEPEPGAAIELGVKVTVWALPCPVADKVIGELKVPEMAVVILADPEPLRATVIAVGDALIEKLGLVLTGVTVKVTVVLSVVLPEVPFNMTL